jgi:hypothetical protein
MGDRHVVDHGWIVEPNMPIRPVIKRYSTEEIVDQFLACGQQKAGRLERKQQGAARLPSMGYRVTQKQNPSFEAWNSSQRSMYARFLLHSCCAEQLALCVTHWNNMKTFHNMCNKRHTRFVRYYMFC